MAGLRCADLQARPTEFLDVTSVTLAALQQLVPPFERIHLWKEGIRDLVMELCCALHNFRVRLSPWQPMV